MTVEIKATKESELISNINNILKNSIEHKNLVIRAINTSVTKKTVTELVNLINTHSYDSLIIILKFRHSTLSVRAFIENKLLNDFILDFKINDNSIDKKTNYDISINSQLVEDKNNYFRIEVFKSNFLDLNSILDICKQVTKYFVNYTAILIISEDKNIKDIILKNQKEIEAILGNLKIKLNEELLW